MTYTKEALKGKIIEMYPDLALHKVALNVTYSEEKGAFILRFTRGKDELVTHLDKMDADDCMNNIRCVHLGIKVDQFISNFEARAAFGRTAA